VYNSANFVEKCNISSKEIKEGEQNTKVENVNKYRQYI
jgi:hypothetical protein